MPFLIIGLILLLPSIYFLRKGVRAQDKEMVVGSVTLLTVALILIFVFGLFYRALFSII